MQAGVSYQWTDGVAAFVGIRLDKLQVRYQFGYPLSGKTPRSFTSHMIQAGFSFGQKIK
jgi:hypothetical protein